MTLSFHSSSTMFDYSYYKELLEIAYLHKKYLKFQQLLNTHRHAQGNKEYFKRELKKHTLREQRIEQLMLKHREYYIYFIKEVYGKNKMEQIISQSMNVPDHLTPEDILNHPITRFVSRIN